MSGPYTNIHSSRESYQRTQTEETFSFSSSTPPALPRHNVSETNQDALLSQQTLNEIPVRSSTTTPPPNYPYTQSNTTLVQDPMSEMKFMGHYDSDDDMEKQRAVPPYKDIQQRPYIPLERKKKRSCIDKMCCGCCTCCPKWLRWCTCFIFIIILCICIVIGVLAALFKVPEVSFTDPASPVVSHPSTTAINISSSIGITVQNPNIEGLTFSTIKADAYYPSPYNVFIGGGQVEDVHIESKGTTNFTFPFSVQVDSQESGDQGAIMDLVTRCGLDGSTAKDIELDLWIYPTVHIGVIPITPAIKKSVSFACPLKTEDISSIFGSGGL